MPLQRILLLRYPMILIREVEEPCRDTQCLERVKGRETLGDGNAVISIAVNNKHWRLPIFQQIRTRRIVAFEPLGVAPHERRAAPFVAKRSKRVGLEEESRNMKDTVVADKSLELEGLRLEPVSKHQRERLTRRPSG